MITIKVVALVVVLLMGSDAAGFTDSLPRVDVLMRWLSE